jgi:hypothetical protein
MARLARAITNNAYVAADGPVDPPINAGEGHDE